MATYPNNAVPSYTVEGFSSMADKKPDSGFSYEQEFDIAVFKSEAGYEKRRLKSRRGKRKYELTYTNVTGLHKQAIEQFYRARSGSYESFTLNLEHLSMEGTLNVRFDGSIKVTQENVLGPDLIDHIYTVSFSLIETYD